MEENINIAEILKDKKDGIRLYSPIFGECTFCYVREDTNDICVKKHDGVIEYFNSEGLYFALGEVMLFPSKSMRDWSKFAWKKGDILVNKDAKVHIIFDGFEDDTYKNFNGQYYLWEELGSIVSFEEEENYMQTSDFNKANKEYAQEYIHKIEKELGCKLNMETLEIEKQPEFKDGDIITFKDRIIIIYNTSIEKSPERTEIYYHACLKEGELTVNEYLMSYGFGEGWYSSTEEEKHNLFEALAKKGKRWDSEKKQIVDLKPKYEFKPMDLCLMKYIGQYNNRGWELCQYAYTEHRVSLSGEQRDFYHAVGGEIYAECIPYNEDTKHLLGTRDEWKGGEG